MSASGAKSRHYNHPVTDETIRKFCEATGARYRGDAPPTFMTIFREGEFEIWKDLGVQLSAVLHADQQYDYGEPIRAGDVLEYETILVKDFEKSGRSGRMRFMTFETRFQTRRGDGQALPAGVSTTTVIMRDGGAAT